MRSCPWTPLPATSVPGGRGHPASVGVLPGTRAHPTWTPALPPSPPRRARTHPAGNRAASLRAPLSQPRVRRPRMRSGPTHGGAAPPPPSDWPARPLPGAHWLQRLPVPGRAPPSRPRIPARPRGRPRRPPLLPKPNAPPGRAREGRGRGPSAGPFPPEPRAAPTGAGGAGPSTPRASAPSVREAARPAWPSRLVRRSAALRRAKSWAFGIALISHISETTFKVCF